MTKPPSLEVVSSDFPPGEKSGSGGPERRRLPRLNLSGEQFRLSLNGKIFSVCDLSAQGMGLRILEREDFLLFPVATVFEGYLNLQGEKHPVSARVRHLGSDAVGCEFENLSVEASGAMSRFLDPAALGRELKAIPSSESGTLWYNGPSGTDLLVKRTADGQFHRMVLYLLGSYVQWTEEAGLSTGKTRVGLEQSETRGILRFETLWLDEDSPLDASKVAIAKTLILSSNLAEDFKKWCVRKLET